MSAKLTRKQAREKVIEAVGYISAGEPRMGVRLKNSDADAILDALEVELEPEVESLPARLELPFHTQHDSHGPIFTMSADHRDGQSEAVAVSVCGPSLDFCRRLALTLVTAYNTRHEHPLKSWDWATLPFQTLPFEGQSVVAIVEDINSAPVFTGVMATIAHRAPSGGWVMPDDFKVETVRVLAWQPLPVL